MTRKPDNIRDISNDDRHLDRASDRNDQETAPLREALIASDSDTLWGDR